MTWSVVRGPWSVVGALLLAGVLTFVAPAADQAPPRPADDVQDRVLLADPHPVLVRLHVLVDGKPFRAVHRGTWDEYLKRLFRHLDRNGDGVLDEQEAAAAPPPELSLPGIGRRAGDAPAHIAFNFRAVDADGDGRVTPAEL